MKQKVAGTVDRLADDLEALLHRIHDNPELCFNEEKAHAWLTEFLEKHGAQRRALGRRPGDGVPGDHQRIRSRTDHRHPG